MTSGRRAAISDQSSVVSRQLSAVHGQRGIVLILSLIILLVVTAIGIGITTIVVGEIRLSATTRSGTAAFYAAESGIERALYTISSNRQDPSACLDSASCGGPNVVPTIKTFTGANVPSFSNGATYDTSGTASVVKSVVASLPRDAIVQVDIFDPDASLSTPMDPSKSICTIRVQGNGSGSEWAEVSWTGWDTNGVFSTKPKSQFIAHSDLTAGFNVNLGLDDLPCTAANGFRLRVKAVFDAINDLTITAHPNDTQPLQSRDIPARILVKSVGSISGVKQAIIADLPWKVPLGGLFDYVLFSEETLAKEITTGTPIYSSGVIEVEDAYTGASCTGCTTVAACGQPGATCADCGWKATSCLVQSAAQTCSTVGGVGSCHLGRCGVSSWTLPIPDAVPGGDAYYLSVKGKFSAATGEHLNATIANPGVADQTIPLNDQGTGDVEPCTISQPFELKPISGRTVTFSEVGPAYSSTDVSLDWYQISTYKLFGDCQTDTSSGSGSVCALCGNGTREGTEECDGSDFGTATCATRGFNNGGTLACRPPGAGGCTIDDAQCFECPDGTCETGENCPADASSCPAPPQCKQTTCTSGCGTADLPLHSQDACNPNERCCGAPLACTAIACGSDSDCANPCKKCSSPGLCTAQCVDKASPGDCSLTSDGCCPAGCTPANDADCVVAANFDDHFLRDRSVDEDGNILSSLPGSGKTLRTGSAWNTQFSNPSVSTGFRDIHGIDKYDIWAAGDNDIVYHFNGTSWTPQTPPGSGKRYFGVWAADRNNVWAVGGNQADNLGAVIIKTSNGGASWQTETLPGGVTSRLLGIYGLNASNIWAVGFSGTVLYYNGSTWIQLTTADATQQLNDVWVANSSNVWTVSDAGQIRKCTTTPCTTAPTTWSANQVTASACLSATTHRIEGITGIDATHVWASGRNSLSTQGVIMHSANGSTWCDAAASGGMVTNTTTSIRDIFTNDTTYSAGSVNIWASGFGGKTYYSKGVLSNSWQTVVGGPTATTDFYQANGTQVAGNPIQNFNQYGVWSDRQAGATVNVWAAGLDTSNSAGRILLGSAPGADLRVQLGVDQRWYSVVYPGPGRGNLTIPTATYRGIVNVTRKSISGGNNVRYELSFGVCRDGADADTTLCNNTGDEFTTIGTSAIISYGSTVAIGPHVEAICSGCPAAPVSCTSASPCRVWYRLREPGTSSAGATFDINMSGHDSTTSGTTIDQSFLDKL